MTAAGPRSRISWKEAAALAACLFVAVFWLNQGSSLAAWKARDARIAAGEETLSVLGRVQRPFGFLYRRALDEEMYFATASATLGQPYDRAIFAIRGATSLKPVDVPPDGRFHTPYAEVPFEYPPPNVPFVIAPRLVASTFDGYARLLAGLMGIVLVAAALLGIRVASDSPRDGEGDRRDATDRGDSSDIITRLVAFALLLLAHGALAIQRLDALVALVLVLAVVAAVRGQDRLLGFWCGILLAIKVVPVLAGIAIVAASGPLFAPRRLTRLATGAGAGVALGLGPMLVLSPGGLGEVLRYHAARGLHVESSLGVLYGFAKALAGHAERGVLDYGSFNFHGGVADGLAKLSTLVIIAVVGLVVVAGARRQRAGGTSLDERAIVVAALAAVVAIWLGGKVFSPQYLTWALPLAVSVPGRGWRRIALLFGGVLVLSQLYYRGYYDHVYNQRPLGIATMTVRLVLLAALFRSLVTRLGAGVSSRSPAPGAARPAGS